MAIKVYILKKSIVKSSVDEYLQFKAELREKKRMAKQMNPEESLEQKQKKDLRTVFISTSDTALQALEIAGITYEGDIDLDDIEFCKVEAQQKCICGNLHVPKLNDVLGEKIRMYFFANRKNIVIIDDEGFAEKVIQRIIASRTKPGQSRERFLYSFCIKFMDQDLDNLGRYEKKIMQIEEKITGGDLDDVTSEIARLRKELLILREYYDELCDFGKQLEENENNFFSGKNLEYFGTISDRADRLMGRTMYLLDYIGQVRDTYQGKVAEKQNSNMEFLTIISTIFFPLTLITGWYGMNFQNMPELAHGYPFVIGLSLVVVAGIIFIFKKRKIL
ncbi:MAG: CorA family divalent cation transporter [Muricoprocola sp.]